MHAVIFDVDGTLLQSASVDDDLYRQSVRSVVGPVRFRSSLAEYDFVTDSGILSQVLVDNSIPADPDPIPKIKACFVQALSTHIDKNGPFSEIPGAKDMLHTLSASETHAAAIATGGWKETAHLKLVSAGFNLTNLPIASSDDSIERTEIMRIALSGLGSDFDTITYYGDGPWDRDACLSLGWRFIAVGPVLGGISSYSSVGLF
jgi:FMN phosphatase YigB (HAD superfamily)